MENQTRHIDIWNDCLHILKQLVEPQQYETWFKPIKAVSITESTLTIEVPTDFFREYLEGAFLDVIKKTLKRVIGADARLVYLVRPVKSEEAMRYPASQGIAPTGRTISVSTYDPSGNPGPLVFPGLHKIKVNPRLNPVYCFKNLIQGDCNKMGINAGENISMAPGKTPFNPLFLFGGPGLGKTHIAQAIGLSITEQFPDQVVLYVTGNEFKTQYMDAVNVRNKLTDFLAYYMKMDVLIVDDIQDLLGVGSQTAFFNIFNHLHQSGKQLIFTSDRAPVDLQNFEERLLSRFKWGLSVELKKPDYHTRLSMLKARCFREGVSISDDVLDYMANHIRSNFRELEGTLISFMAHATLNHQDPDLELARSITDNIVGDEKEELTIAKVQTVVCDYFNISKNELVSKSRKRQIVQARQIAMFMSRQFISNCSLATIGAELGGKDHATVLHACTTVSDLMSTDRTFRQYVNDIGKMLNPIEQ